MTGRLQGRVAFLTAAGAGIGRATAELSRRGARVIATDLDGGALEGLAPENHPLDVRSTEAVGALGKAAGRSTSWSTARAMSIAAAAGMLGRRMG